MNSEKKIQSQLYRMYELRTELLRGQESYKKMIPQYKAIIDIYTHSKRKKDVPENFLSQFEEDLTNLKKGLDNINYRLNCIGALLTKAEENPDSRSIVDWFVTLIFNALGMGLNDKEEQDDKNAVILEMPKDYKPEEKSESAE